jgi:hypothetical protein
MVRGPVPFSDTKIKKAVFTTVFSSTVILLRTSKRYYSETCCVFEINADGGSQAMHGEYKKQWEKLQRSYGSSPCCSLARATPAASSAR